MSTVSRRPLRLGTGGHSSAPTRGERAVLHLNLNAPERRGLERQLRAAVTPRLYRRTLALLEVGEGRAVADVARMLRVSREAVYRWLVLYSERRDPAALVDRPRCGRPTFWTGET